MSALSLLLNSGREIFFRSLNQMIHNAFKATRKKPLIKETLLVSSKHIKL